MNPKKVIVITGPEECGKTFISNNISLAFENPLFISGRCIKTDDPFLFQDVEEDTDLIILDDVKPENVSTLVFMCYGYIYIEKRFEKQKKIKAPLVIINTTNFKPNIKGRSLDRRMKLVVISKNIDLNNKPKISITSN